MASWVDFDSCGHGSENTPTLGGLHSTSFGVCKSQARLTVITDGLCAEGDESVPCSVYGPPQRAAYCIRLSLASLS